MRGQYPWQLCIVTALLLGIPSVAMAEIVSGDLSDTECVSAINSWKADLKTYPSICTNLSNVSNLVAEVDALTTKQTVWCRRTGGIRKAGLNCLGLPGECDIYLPYPGDGFAFGGGTVVTIGKDNLLHELVHAFQHSQGRPYESIPASGLASEADVEAVDFQNQYRVSHSLPQRDNYNRIPLPDQSSYQVCGDNQCFNTRTDSQHCGGCDIACLGGQVCMSGGCECPSGQAVCNGQCTSPPCCPQGQAACGGACCTGGQQCNNGVCGCGGQTCGASESCCSGKCTDTRSDRNNCSQCGISCPSTETCQDSQCTCPVRTCGRGCCGAGVACFEHPTGTYLCGCPPNPSWTECPDASSPYGARCLTNIFLSASCPGPNGVPALDKHCGGCGIDCSAQAPWSRCVVNPSNCYLGCTTTPCGNGGSCDPTADCFGTACCDKRTGTCYPSGASGP